MKIVHAMLFSSLTILIAACGAKQGSYSSKDGAPEQVQEGRADESFETTSDIQCRWQEDTRRIKNVLDKDQGCEVRYTRNGESEVIAHAKNDLSFCDKIVRQTKQNLNEAGFECQPNAKQQTAQTKPESVE